MKKWVKTWLLDFLRTWVDTREVDRNICPLFVIVHEDCVNRRLYPRQHKEIERIKKEEDFVKIDGDPKIIPLHMPRGRKILVCGAYGGGCVLIQFDTLIKNGFDAKMYKKAIGWRP